MVRSFQKLRLEKLTGLKFRQLLESLARSGHGLVYASEHAISAAIAPAVHRTWTRCAHLRQHLLDDVANEIFGGLHSSNEW